MNFLADMGVPMIGVYWPPAWLAFIPVVMIEAWWVCRTLGGTWGKAIAVTFAANAVSTIIGMPLTWFIWSTIELRFFGTALGLDNPAKSIYAVTVQAAWLIPYEQHLWWMLPIAAFVLTAVFFVGSVGVEWLVVRGFYRQAEARLLRRWAWKANLLSYAIVFAFVVLFLYVPRDYLDLVAGRPVNALIEATWQAAKWLSPAAR